MLVNTVSFIFPMVLQKINCQEVFKRTIISFVLTTLKINPGSKKGREKIAVGFS